MSGEQAIFNLEIKKKSGLSLNIDIHHSKVFSSGQISFFISCMAMARLEAIKCNFILFSTAINNL